MSAIATAVAPQIAAIDAARQAGDWDAVAANERILWGKVVTGLAQFNPPVLTRGPWTLTVLDGPKVVIVAGQPVLDLTVELRFNTIPLPIDGHLRYPNPRYRVRETDGTATDAPLRALYQMVLDTLAEQVSALRGQRA